MGKRSGRGFSIGEGLSLFLIFAVLVCSPACRNGALPGKPSGSSLPDRAEAVPAPAQIDRALDERFTFAAGFPATAPSYRAWQDEPSWKGYSSRAGEAWAEYAAAVLEPMRIWAGKDLAEVREKTNTLFYPFGGPDFATSATLFPDAATTVLIGLEPVGNMPDFSRSSVKEREDFFTDLGTLTSEFLTHGYFITMHMMDTYSLGHVDGALPVVGFFLKRAGYSVVDVRRLAPDEKGSWKDTPYEALAKRPRRPYGVRIDYVDAGGGPLRSVYYFSCDIENSSFPPGSPLFRFFEDLGNLTTFVKAGSYLLHWENFSNLRGLILDRSLFVLQDDTAVPYRFFKRGGWDVTLFGRYTSPVKDFTNVEQPDLREAYEDRSTDVRPLPFHFGYRWRTQVENILLAKRPRRPYKVPVLH
jgi:hypothetical protein